MINFLQMKYFLEVAGAGSFSAAARKLYVSQQTLSAHIAQIEAEVGTPLFERTRPLTITAAGERFMRGAQEMLFINDQMEREFCDMTDPNKNSLKIGISHAYARALLPRLLERFYTSYPNANLQIYEMMYEQMDEALLAGKLDLAITRPPYSRARNIKIVQLKKYDDVFLYAPLLSLQNACGEKTSSVVGKLRRRASLEIVRNCPFILPRAGTVRSDTLQMLLDAKISPYVRTETDTLETAIFLCRKGLGITVSPGVLLQAYNGGEKDILNESGYLLSHQKPEHALAICYPEDIYVAKAMRAFINVAKEEIDDKPY